MPEVSIGMPVYNGEKYIEKAIESILNQTFEDFELIISDNNSSDSTKDICMKYVEKDPRIKYFYNKTNIGAAKNFNRVFQLSQGELFRWHSADDLCAPTLIEKCKQVLDNCPEAVLCSVGTVLIDSTDNIICHYEDELDICDPNPSRRLFNLNLKLGLCNAQYGLMRSSVLCKTMLEGDYPGSDVVFLAELILYGYFMKVPEYLFFRRMHSEASSNLKSPEEQQIFWDPNKQRHHYYREWKHLFEYMKLVLRTPLSTWERLRVTTVILTWVKWGRMRLLSELLMGFKVLLGGALQRSRRNHTT
jgi:glycosyltransferase involved in cell wall biosynthesis